MLTQLLRQVCFWSTAQILAEVVLACRAWTGCSIWLYKSLLQEAFADLLHRISVAEHRRHRRQA